jgi:hypothetical protein
MKNRKLPAPKGCLIPLAILLSVFVGLYYVLSYWGNSGIPTYIKRGTHSWNIWAKDLNKMDFAFTDKGEVVWIHSYYRSSGKNYSTYYYQLDLIELNPKKLIKKYYFTQDYSGVSSSEMSDFLWTGKYFSIANKLFPLQFRSPATGEIVIDEKAFIAKFPALKAGIGEIFKNDLGYSINTKDGQKFYYFAERDWLLPEKEYEENKYIHSYHEKPELHRKDREIEYAWGISDKMRGELYLVKQYVSVYTRLYPQDLKTLLIKQKDLDLRNKERAEEEKRVTELLSRLENPAKREELQKTLKERHEQHAWRGVREQNLVKHIENQVFLNGEIVYGDSTLCVVKHQSEVGRTGKTLISLANSHSKVKQYDLRLFKNTQEVSVYNLKAYRKDNKLAIVSNHHERMGVALIDLQKEEIIWEYIPTED